MGNTRDYYADLELPPSADVPEIKKQFRKLALKYHPDRNPGREAEVNSQFQIIQSAHEVLSDPQQKAKYDATLGRKGYSGASGVKGNPWSNVSQQFPTPPRRGQPSRASAAASGAGAQRWQSRFSSGVPPTAKQQTASDPEAKKNAARAFENMRKNQAQANSKTTRGNKPTEPPPPPPRTETARQRAEASFGNRKSGFYPRSAAPGDEPPVTSKNYYTRSTAERTDPEATPEPRRPRPTQMPDPLSQFRERDRDPYADPRQSTPYTTHGGEKTNPFDGVTPSRAKSHKEPSRRDASGSAEDAFAAKKQRSSSVPKTSAKHDTAPGLSVPNDDQRPHTADESYAKSSFKDRASAKYAPGNSAQARDGPGMEPPHASSTGAPPKGRAGSATGPSMYDTPKNRRSHHNPACVGTSDQVTPTKKYTRAANHERDQAASTYESLAGSPLNRTPSGAQTTPHQLTPFEKKQHELLDHLITNASACSSTDKRDCHITKTSRANSKDLANRSYSNSFSFSVDDDTFAQTSPDHSHFGRSSVENINTQFVNGEGSTEWRFNAGSPGQGTDQRRTTRQPRSPTKRSTMPPNDATEAKEPESKPETGFNADGWSDKFGPQTFVPQSTPGTSVSPTRRGTGKKTKASKPTAGNAAVVDDSSSEEEAFEWPGRKAQAPAAEMDSPQAMDIDSPPAVSTESSPKPNGVRNIPVEPSRPDWRPGNVENVNGTGTSEEQVETPPNPNAAGSEDSEEFRASLRDLRNVEPLAQPQGSGLKSLGDLKDNLPFESKASNNISIKIPKAPPLLFPDPPVAPRRPPSVAISGMKPNVSSWMKYADEFEVYVREWDKFNSQVVDHFATRNQHISNTRAEKGYGFLASRSDVEIQDYYNSVQQDNDVRRRWCQACEEHEQRLREFVAFKEKMKMS